MKNYRLYRFNPITKGWTPAETADTLEEAIEMAKAELDRINDATWTGAKYRAGTWWKVYYMPTFAEKAEVK